VEEVRLRKVDIGLGLGLMLCAVFAIAQSLALPLQQRGGVPGPGMAPFLLSIGLFLLSALLFISRLRGTPESFGPVAWPSRRELLRVVAAVAAVGASIALLKPLGYFVSTVLLVAFLVLAIERISPVKAVVLIVGLPALFYVVFAVLLGVRLPALAL
jgi:L-lactate permease